MTDELEEINNLIIEQCVIVFEKEGGWKSFYVIHPKTLETIVQGYTENDEAEIRKEWGEVVLEKLNTTSESDSDDAGGT